MNNNEQWEETFRRRWEGANTGGHNAISTPVMNELLTDISELLSELDAQHKEEIRKLIEEIPDANIIIGWDHSGTEAIAIRGSLKGNLIAKYLK